MPEETNYNHHMSYEQHLKNEHQRIQEEFDMNTLPWDTEDRDIQEQLESDYKTYCNHCDDKPLSYENWLHCEINQVSKGNDDDLPF
jgi:hypothetical protein